MRKRSRAHTCPGHSYSWPRLAALQYIALAFTPPRARYGALLHLDFGFWADRFEIGVWQSAAMFLLRGCRENDVCCVGKPLESFYLIEVPLSNAPNCRLRRWLMRLWYCMDVSRAATMRLRFLGERPVPLSYKPPRTWSTPFFRVACCCSPHACMIQI